MTVSTGLRDRRVTINVDRPPATSTLALDVYRLFVIDCGLPPYVSRPRF
jgi:hypothetical protein